MSRDATLVTAGILVKDGQVLLARRPAEDRLAGHWELPGGKVEVGETPKECLARELAEELAIAVSVGALFAESLHRDPHVTIHLLAFWVDSWSGELERHAHDDHRWVTLGEVGQLTLAPADVPIVQRLQIELA